MFEYVKVYLGEERDLDALLEELVNLGFERVDQVLNFLDQL